MSTSTYAVQIFQALAAARRQAVPMIPRSAGDKEYFAQDWFADRLEELGLVYEQQGRNSYPDFLVGEGDDQEGYEIKSLSFYGGRPARKDLDFNSTIPSGEKDGRPVFLVFFLYEGSKADPRSVHTISVAHGDLINCDHQVADEHVNVKIPRFGSYADGFIRNRKMYVFPHPVTLNPSGLGEARLFLPSSWQIDTSGLGRVGTVSRTVADEALDSYGIHLYGRTEPRILREKYDEAGEEKEFAVYEMA